LERQPTRMRVGVFASRNEAGMIVSIPWHEEDKPYREDEEELDD